MHCSGEPYARNDASVECMRPPEYSFVVASDVSPDQRLPALRPNRLKLGFPSAPVGTERPQPVSRAACATTTSGSTPSFCAAARAAGRTACTNSSGERGGQVEAAEADVVEADVMDAAAGAPSALFWTPAPSADVPPPMS